MNTDEHRPSIACLGVGAVGRHRMRCVVEHDAAEVIAVSDVSPDALAAALRIVPSALAVGLEELLELDVDGVMIATPSAVHAEQAVALLKRRRSVFCQKPLARDAEETRLVIDAAQRADRRLAVDFSYRHVRGVRQMREMIASGELGRVFAIDLTFHNAHGPDKSWCYDAAQSGGGALVDLGIHLIDLALWLTGARTVHVVDGCCYAAGRPVRGGTTAEDYASARLELDTGAVVELKCSWNQHAGCDAMIAADFRGTKGAVSLRNISGSLYGFRVEHHRGTTTEVVAEPPDAWDGRAATAWARALARDRSYDPDIESAWEVAAIVDAIYGGRDV